MFLLTLRDLQYRAMRFALVIVGTTIVFALLLLMDGLAAHFYREPLHSVRAIGADAWILPKGVSGPFTAAVTMDPSVAAAVTGVDRADPLIAARSSLWISGSPREVILIGYVSGGIVEPPLVAGAEPISGNQVVLDETTGLRPGAHVRIGSGEFAVSGLSRDTTLLAGVPLGFMGLADAQAQVFGGRDVATAVLTRGHPTQAPPGFQIMSNSQVAEDARHPLERAVSSLNLVRTLLWIVSAMIIGGVVYLSSMERRRDFAVLKAIGGSTRALLSGLAAQGVFVAAAAAGLAAVLQLLLAPTFPLKVEVTPQALLQLPALALAVSLLASAAGMRRVARIDPALAFSGPGG